ncbi:MAG: hypothetical protein UT84_C0048G0006 [Candidatus Curtissbacteria bacterium GW2011_GWA1_40_16]|uniref:PNPLA domain-containing protein n=1 Tax=Candidatus Curtissbacteria bacterium GW2011_GWA1_40_16 TaxID=1618405 RepID=A0A0G0RE30_9BACT|nr:MAG: hypothetical protein UT84_C0048G0006 [Candidatus Curtissbacteria bacterium GW2011_GWA1_40_16]
MDYEGDLSILSRLKRGEGRIGMLGLSGCNAGVVGSEQAAAFEKHGLVQNLKVIAAVSSFAGPALYLTAGKLHEGKSCFWEECTMPNFLRFTPQRFLQGTAANVGFLVEEVFRPEIGTSAFSAYSGDFVVAVTDYETGRGHLVDVGSAKPDLFAAIHATMAIPVLYRNPVYVNGRRCYDGVVGMPCPAVEVIEQWNLDGLILIANRTRQLRDSFGRRLTEAMLSMGMSPARRRAMLLRHSLVRDGLHKLRQSKVPHLILWDDSGDQEIGTYDRDPAVIEAVGKRVYEETVQLLSHAS